MAKVKRIKEYEDGSADVTLELTDEEIGLLINDAITRAIENYLKELDNE